MRLSSRTEPSTLENARFCSHRQKSAADFELANAILISPRGIIGHLERDHVAVGRNEPPDAEAAFDDTHDLEE